MNASTRSKVLRPVFACLLFAAAAGAAAQTPSTPPSVLSISDIDSRMVAQGISIREIELRDLVAEVEGRDAQGRKVELLIDRRSGEILSRKLEK